MGWLFFLVALLCGREAHFLVCDSFFRRSSGAELGWTPGASEDWVPTAEAVLKHGSTGPAAWGTRSSSAHCIFASQHEHPGYVIILFCQLPIAEHPHEVPRFGVVHFQDCPLPTTHYFSLTH